MIIKLMQLTAGLYFARAYPFHIYIMLAQVQHIYNFLKQLPQRLCCQCRHVITPHVIRFSKWKWVQNTSVF